MEQLDEDDLRRLTGQARDAEFELDLRGLDVAHAGESVLRMLERARFREPRSVLIRLDPPEPGGGETLFQPIGRMLLEARRAGQLTRYSTLPPEAGLGFYVLTAGKPDDAPEGPAGAG